MSTPSPTPQAPRSRHRLRTTLVTTLVLVVFACVVGAPLLSRYVSGRIDAEGAANRDRAEAAVEQHAREFAQAVVADGDRDIPDGRLGELARNSHVAVLVVERPSSGSVELRVVIKAVQHYLSDPLFGGTSDLVACYEVVFSGLGTAAAQHGYNQLEPCPANDTP